MAMTTRYSCDLCKKVFNQKIDFTRHRDKKTPCITLTEMQQISQTNELKMDNKTTLIRSFKNCLNILRDNGECLTGDRALRNMSYLLILKLLEPHFGVEIDIDNYEYDFSTLEEEVIEKTKETCLKMVRFSNLVKEEEDNIPHNMNYVWDYILSQHPTTKKIFLKGKGFDIQHKLTYKKLIVELNTIPVTDIDILGSAYEEVIQDIMTGKTLGQYFTPVLVKNMMVKLINPQIHKDGKMDTCCDPTMGTGGFLITILQHVRKQATSQGIDVDWDFIKTEGLYGKELEPTTYQLALSNMLISSGHMFEHLDRGDSLAEPITRKFDNVLANMPFSMTFQYDNFQSPLKKKYIPIKTDRGVSLFIQAIISMLKIKGKCAVVLPDGQDLFSTTNTTLVTIREYLMKTCDLKEIIYLPSGIFTYTPIKTCVFYFVKKKEGIDVLNVVPVCSKTTQKETKRHYTFSNTHQTTKVKFYDYNPYEDVKNLLVEVPIEKIASNSYSLNYAEYMKDDAEEEQYEEGIVVKTLGEVCKFLPKSKRNAKYGNEEGLYPFFKSSIKVNGYVDEPDYVVESLIIGDGGEPNINYGIRFSASDHCYILQNKNNFVLNLKYVYYYIYHNLDIMKQLYTGVAIKNISKTNIEGIKIPMPSLERQQEIVKYVDFIYEKANKTSNEKIADLKQLNEFMLTNQKKYGENEIKTLGKVFKEVKTGKDVKTTNRKKGEYPFYGANGIIDYVDSYIFDGKYLLTARTGSLGSLHISNGKFWCSGDVHRMEFENDTLLSYTYYYLQTIDFQKFRTGAAHPKLSGTSLKSIKIPIPSHERQREIVENCEYNDILIKQLEKEIENNKKQAQQFMTSIVKSQSKSVEEEQDDKDNIIFKVSNEVKEEILSVEENNKKNVEYGGSLLGQGDGALSNIPIISGSEEAVVKPNLKLKIKKYKKKLVVKDDN